MKYFSMFSGIGGFELGIQRACNKQSTEIEQNRQRRNGNINKMEHDVLPTSRTSPLCIGYSEIDKYAIQIYKQHFKEHECYGSARDIVWGEAPDFDLFVGGFPCQSFSIAGKRGGFEDCRGTLFFEIARALSAKRPQLCLLENVKGLLSHDRGRTFGTILATLSELGYICQWQVLNSKNFGVPQNRERVFIVGHFRGKRRPEVFPIGESNVPISKKGNEQPIHGTLSTKNQSGQAQWDRSTTLIVKRIAHNDVFRRYNQTYDIGGICESLDTSGGGGHQPCIPHHSRVRRLTPTECERLQGFPDGWTEGVSDTQRYKCLGNAVTVNVIEAIMERLLWA